MQKQNNINQRFFTQLDLRNTVCKKDSLQKYIDGDPHKYAANLLKKEKTCASAFSEDASHHLAIGRGLVKTTMRDKEVLEYCFNATYYLARKERPYRDFT